jgi:hypothetical protein
MCDQRTYLVCASARREETWILGCGRINGIVRSIELWLEGGLRVELEVREENVREPKEDRGEDWSLLELALETQRRRENV